MSEVLVDASSGGVDEAASLILDFREFLESRSREIRARMRTVAVLSAARNLAEAVCGQNGFLEDLAVPMTLYIMTLMRAGTIAPLDWGEATEEQKNHFYRTLLEEVAETRQ